MTRGQPQDAGQPPAKQQHDARGGVAGVEVQPLGKPEEDHENAPKMPHERDQTTGPESTSNATGEGNAKLMKKAKDDVDSGRQDTDRGPVMDATYQKQKR